VNLLPSPPHGSAPGFAQICPDVAAALRALRDVQRASLGRSSAIVGMFGEGQLQVIEG
jgi:hypothetical protein